jgi:hypothetical protein
MATTEIRRRAPWGSRHASGAVLAALLACGVSLGCSDDTAEGDETTIDVSALTDAEAVSIADLTMMEEEASGKERLRTADFLSASKAKAKAIAELMGDEDSYAETENACFNHDVGVEFELRGGRAVQATVGLTCWNVRFYPVEDTEVAPNVRYLQPKKLKALAELFHDVVPAIDISHIDE